MKISNQGEAKMPRILFRALLAATLVITLLAGLTPKDFAFDNAVSRTLDPPGLKFGKYGVGVVSMGEEGDPAPLPDVTELTIEVLIKAAPHTPGAFMFIGHLFGDGADEQLVLGQWRNRFIAMNGDDYSYVRKLPRVSVDLSKVPSGTVRVTVVSGSAGTGIYLNGAPAIFRDGVKLKIPQGSDVTKLTLGNGVGRNQSWPGALHRFALMSRALSDAEIAESAVPSDDKNTEICYLFAGDPTGDRVVDVSGHGRDLMIPKNGLALRSEFLSESLWRIENDHGTDEDILLNFFGFIPVTCCLAWGLRHWRRWNWLLTSLIVLGAGFSLSLFIEVTQAWMPSRSSSMRDLTLNTIGSTFGGLVGSLGYSLWLRWGNRLRSEK